MASEFPADLRVNDKVTLTLVPPEGGVGNVYSYIYGPFVGLRHEDWGVVILRPDDALRVAEWLIEHREQVLALQEEAQQEAQQEAQASDGH